MVKLFVTKKGSELKTNNWKEGQEIECHENLANDFLKNGLVQEQKEVKQIKTKTKEK
jgi:hypothetical protein